MCLWRANVILFVVVMQVVKKPDLIIFLDYQVNSLDQNWGHPQTQKLV